MNAIKFALKALTHLYPKHFHNASHVSGRALNALTARAVQLAAPHSLSTDQCAFQTVVQQTLSTPKINAKSVLKSAKPATSQAASNARTVHNTYLAKIAYQVAPRCTKTTSQWYAKVAEIHAKAVQ
jgi:hypothetical protein